MLTSSVRAQSAGSISSQRAVGPAIPALLTSTSRPPSVRSASSKRRATAARSATSQTLRVKVASEVASASSALLSTSHTCTRAPSRTNARAVASPMPLAPAVTRTRASFSWRSMVRVQSVAPHVGRAFRYHSRDQSRYPTAFASYLIPATGGIMNRLPFSRRRRALLQGSAAVTALGLPAIVKSQSDAFRFGHLTPRTGFLGPLGEYAVMGVTLAVEEINAAGGVMGRKIELIAEDSVNPQTASTKAERLLERDKVAVIIGEISSASGLAIAQVALRNKKLFFNTGCNSDELRGKSCNRYMFHTEAANSMYVNACGQALLRDGMVKGKKWYSLTADYAFGHDLLKVAKRFMTKNGGEFAADELVATDVTDFSPFMLKIRNAKPDLVVSNLAGAQITNFMKQYMEFGLPYPVAGFG